MGGTVEAKAKVRTMVPTTPTHIRPTKLTETTTIIPTPPRTIKTPETAHSAAAEEAAKDAGKEVGEGALLPTALLCTRAKATTTTTTLSIAPFAPAAAPWTTRCFAAKGAPHRTTPRAFPPRTSTASTCGPAPIAASPSTSSKRVPPRAS